MQALILTGDHHANSTVGLCPGSITLDDEGTYTPNKTQRWLWRYWRECWQEAKAFTAQAERRIWIMNGDLVDTNRKDRSSQYITNNKATALKIALDVIAPGLDVVDTAMVIRGTDAHVGQNAWMEENIANDITGVKVITKDDKVSSWYHYRGVLDGLRLDVAHHTSMGTLPWTEKNAANKLAADAVIQYTLAGNKPPDLLVRSHVHKTADSYDNYPTRAVILPAWQSMTNYGTRLNPNRLSDIGMIIFLVENGKIVGEKKMIEKLSQPRNLWTNTL